MIRNDKIMVNDKSLFLGGANIGEMEFCVKGKFVSICGGLINSVYRFDQIKI
jgi:hypothetical protein